MIKIIKEQAKRFCRWMHYDPPISFPTKGWRLFNADFKKSAPIRYYIVKKFRRNFILPIKIKFDRVYYWIRYRTVDRYHVISTGLTPDYYEIPAQMLHVNFNMLKEFVEVETAWSTYLFSDEYKEKASWFEKHMPFYYTFFPFRSPEYGLLHLEWASTLDDPSLPTTDQSPLQAQGAREIMALYKWWVEERPARRDVDAPIYSDQGLGMMASLDEDFDHNAPDYVEWIQKRAENNELRQKWEKEDEEMLIRLMKVRDHLWT